MYGLRELVDLRCRGWQPEVGVLWHLRNDGFKPPLDDRPRMAIIVTPVDFGRPDVRALIGLRVIVVGPMLEVEAVVLACQAAVQAGAAKVVGFATDHWKLTEQGSIYSYEAPSHG